MASDCQLMADLYGTANGYFDGEDFVSLEEECHEEEFQGFEEEAGTSKPQPNYDEYMSEVYVSPYADSLDYEKTSELIRNAEARLHGITTPIDVIPQELHHYAWTIICNRSKPELSMTAFLAADALDQDPRQNLEDDLYIPF